MPPNCAAGAEASAVRWTLPYAILFFQAYTHANLYTDEQHRVFSMYLLSELAMYTSFKALVKVNGPCSLRVRHFIFTM